MPSTDMRSPPRFVPTLTDVVADSAALSLPSVDTGEEIEQSKPGRRAAETYLAGSVEVHQAEEDTDVEARISSVALSLQARLMERLDEALEERLRYALMDIVQVHTQELHRVIREDVEQLVKASVHEAIAQELAQIHAASKR